jgi:hypothetical protein
MVLGEHDVPCDRAVVLGAGATATSMLLALAERGCGTPRSWSATRTGRRDPCTRWRAPLRARRSSCACSTALGGWPATSLVSTVPVSAQVPELLAAVASPLVFDVVYDPWPTPLAAAAERSGRTVLSGARPARRAGPQPGGRHDRPARRAAGAMRRAAEESWPRGRAVTDLYPVTAVRPACWGWSRGLVPRLIASVPEPDAGASRDPREEKARARPRPEAQGALRRHRGPAGAAWKRHSPGGQRGGDRAGPRLEPVAARGAAAGAGRRSRWRSSTGGPGCCRRG